MADAGTEKILVLRGGAIGDFILTLPVLAALRERFPAARIEILGQPGIAELAVAGGLADRVRSIEAASLAGFFAVGGTLDPAEAASFAKFDLIVSFLFDPEGIFRSNLLRSFSGRFLSGPHRPNEAERIPAAQVYLRALEALGLAGADPLPRLRLDGARAGPDRRRPIALHPGSGSPRKNWPEDNWAALLRHLAETTAFSLLLVGGEAEGDRLPRLAAEVPGDRIELAQGLPLPELARLLQGAAAFLGHDSGISHLAGALGVPSLVLWPDTCEEIWRPPQENVRILKHPGGHARIRVEDALREFDRLLAPAAQKRAP